MTNVQNNETIDLRAACVAVTPGQIGAMTKKIKDSIARRDVFESDNGLDLTATSSWSKAKAKIDKSMNSLARFFVARSIEPKNVIERKVQECAMFNAKALEKVCEVAHYACGNTAKVQMVTRAFLACAIAATDKGVDVITNDVNHRFLSNASFGSMLTDADLVAALDDLRHKSMSSGALTQSSQVRNVLDVLGIGEIVSANHARGAIKLDKSDAFVALYRAQTFKQVTV